VTNGLRDGSHDGPAYGEVLEEHRAYVQALDAAGLRVEVLPALPDFPDSLFVEDPAFVLSEAAIVLRPGAPSRLAEAAELQPELQQRFPRVEQVAEGAVDGGDILVLPDRILVGLSNRTDRSGAAAFARLMDMLGREVAVVETPAGVLHLKTGCALLDEETVLAIPALARSAMFEGFDVVVTPEGEEAAANALRLNDHLLISAAFERTADLLSARAFDIVALPTAGIRKIDAGLSCMSLRWRSA
jgi:dimethylargininase